MFELRVFILFPHRLVDLAAIVIVFLVGVQGVVVEQMSYYIIADIDSAIIAVVECMDEISERFIDPSHAIPYADIPSLTDMEGLIGIRVHIFYHDSRLRRTFNSEFRIQTSEFKKIIDKCFFVDVSVEIAAYIFE